MIVIMHYIATTVIEKHGTEAMRRSIAQEGKLTTLAFSEFGSRSHFWVPVSTATKGADGVRLNAAKQLITSAGVCDIYVWSSKPAAAEGLSSLWAVPADAKGLSIPRPYVGLGLRGNCPADHGPGCADPGIESPGRRWEGIRRDDGRGITLFQPAQLRRLRGDDGRGADARRESRDEFEVFLDGSKIADLPQVRGHIAKMQLKIDMVRALLLDALDAVEQGREDATLRVLESKLAGAETSLEVHDLAMRVCGGAAFRKDVGVERFFRDSRAAGVMAPVSDALYEFIGKAVCGMPVFG